MRLHFEEGERQILAARLGLDESADDATLTQAVATWMQEDPSQNNSGDGNGGNADGVTATNNADDIPEDGSVVVVDVAEFRRLRSRDVQAAAVEEATRRRDRDELIDEAIHDGKFSPSRRQHYIERYDSDPEGTTALIGRLTANTVPLVERGASPQNGEEVDDTSYPAEWLPEVAARQSGGQGQPGPQVAVHRPASRVHSE